MSSVDLIEDVISDINGLILQGIPNWTRALDAVSKLRAVADGLKREQEARQRAYNEAAEDAQKRKEAAQTTIIE